MVKQLGIPKYFLTLSCVDLKQEELSYIINKLNNVRPSREKQKYLSRACNLINNNPVAVARNCIFSVFNYFSKRSCSMVH